MISILGLCVPPSGNDIASIFQFLLGNSVFAIFINITFLVTTDVNGLVIKVSGLVALGSYEPLINKTPSNVLVTKP